MISKETKQLISRHRAFYLQQMSILAIGFVFMLVYCSQLDTNALSDAPLFHAIGFSAYIVASLIVLQRVQRSLHLLREQLWHETEQAILRRQKLGKKHTGHTYFRRLLYTSIYSSFVTFKTKDILRAIHLYESQS